MRIPQQNKRSVTWHEREDGMIDVRARLPKEEAAVLIAAMDAARDQFGPPPPKPDPAGDCCEPAPGAGAYSKADALLDVARVFLNTAPQDRSGEDRTLVVVHVSADNLGRVPAGSQEPAVLRAEPVEAQSTDGACIGGVPAGTSQPAEAVCQIENVGSIETATAQRLACDNPVLGAVVDKHGRVLALGRPKRLVSTAQRRALMIRDHGMCQYPSCHQTRHLKAHHLIPWIMGGRTDLENLILLCQWHHTAVHQGGISISNDPDGWLFTKPDGQPCHSWVSDENLARHLDFACRRAQQQTAKQDQLSEVDSFHHPDARTIRPRWTGEPFDLHACVQALFTIKLPKPGEDQDQQAA
jgi:5-methylcytosine-specific restriction endonuclease McrA